MIRQYITEDQIEREAERMMDQLDKAFLAEGSEMTIEVYHHISDEIEQWTKLRYKEMC
jgi:hypothetical protein